MDRKVAGYLLLVATLVAAVVVAPLIGPGIRGTPVAGPLPEPPPSGTCLAATAGGLEPVACADPHVVEVVRAWRVDDPTVAGVDTREQYRACNRIGRSYLGAAPTDRIPRQGYQIPPLTADWSAVPLIVGTTMIDGPDGKNPIGYRACVIRPQAPTGPWTEVGPITGRVADLVSMPSRPSILRTCYVARDLVSPGIPCTGTHVGEVLAAAEIDPGATLVVAAADPAVAHRCRTLAADLIGVTDPTFGGRLRVVVDGRVVVRDATQGDAETRKVGLLRCLVEAVDGRTLTGSVIDLDAQPLPLR